MAVQFNEYREGVVQINGTAAANTFRVQNLNENPDAVEIRRQSTGRIQPGFSATAVVNPKISFETQEVEKALTLLSSATEIRGVEITTSAIVHWPKQDVVEVSTGTDHLITTINEGVVFPTTLRWDGDNDTWMLGVSIFSSYDGTNNPFVYSTGSLPARITFDEAFIGGKLLVNTVNQDGWQSCTIDFGFEAVQRHGGGAMYPGRAHVFAGMPKITVPHLSLPLRSTYTLHGTTITACDLYLRKQNGPIRWPDTNTPSKHIKLAMVNGIVRVGAVSGRNPTLASVEIGPDETASAVVIAYTAGVDIP